MRLEIVRSETSYTHLAVTKTINCPSLEEDREVPLA